MTESLEMIKIRSALQNLRTVRTEAALQEGLDQAGAAFVAAVTVAIADAPVGRGTGDHRATRAAS